MGNESDSSGDHKLRANTGSLGDTLTKLRADNLTQLQLETFQSVVDNPADSVTEVAKRLDKDKSAVSEAVSTLTSRGLLQKESVGRRKRVVCPYDKSELSAVIPNSGT